MEDLDTLPEKPLPTLTFINPDEVVNTHTLAALLSRNVSLMYQWAQAGKLPDIRNGKTTYREALNHLVTHLLHDSGLKKLRADDKRREKLGFEFGADGEFKDTMHPLMAAKLQQNIKTEYAREAELWQKIAIKRGEYVAFGDKLDLVEGLVTSIRDTLIHISNYHAPIQKEVDQALEDLYQLGLVLCQEAEIDANEFIDTMLKQDVVKEDEIV